MTNPDPERAFTVLDDNQMRRPAVEVAKEIMEEGDRLGSAYSKHSTTILTRQVLEKLVAQVSALTEQPVATVERGALNLKAWKDGRLEPCELSEFIQSLRRYSGWADQEFGTRSDPAAHIGERLNAAADAIAALAEQPRSQGDNCNGG